MTFRELRLPAFLLSCVVGAWSAAAHAGTTSGTVAVTSDYVFRGISQTQSRPALQAGVRHDAEAGWYVAAWASTVDFGAASGATKEIDLVAGWHGALGDGWRGDANVTWFRYPGARVDGGYVELIATATWRERAWVTVGAAPDVFASPGRGLYVQAGTRVPLGSRVRFELAAGRYDLQDALRRNYLHGQASLAWTPHPRLELRAAAHVTDRDARRLFGDAAGPRTELSLQASF